MVLLRDRVKGRVRFSHYTQGELWYTCDDGFTFPVPILEAGNATFLAEDKAIMFMRYIRKHMDMLDTARAASVSSEVV